MDAIGSIVICEGHDSIYSLVTSLLQCLLISIIGLTMQIERFYDVYVLLVAK